MCPKLQLLIYGAAVLCPKLQLLICGAPALCPKLQLLIYGAAVLCPKLQLLSLYMHYAAPVSVTIYIQYSICPYLHHLYQCSASVPK